MAELVCQRLGKLRKHLGERLGHELTLTDLAEKSGIKDYMIQRLESGLKGNTQSLVSLLNFYRSHGYNLDWILSIDNENLPMLISDGNELLLLNEDIQEVSQLLERGFKKINGRLINLGYRSRSTDTESVVPEAAGLAFS